MNVIRVQRDARRWLAQQLALVRERRLSMTQATVYLTKKFEEYGLDNGFMPDQVEVFDNLKRARVTLLFGDYRTEGEIRVGTLN